MGNSGLRYENYIGGEMRTLPPPQIIKMNDEPETFDTMNYSIMILRFELDRCLREALHSQVDQNVCGYVEGLMEYFVGHRNLFSRYKQWGSV